MSAATEQKNNGDVAVEKVAADAVKDDLKSQKAAAEDTKPAAADNGTASKDELHEDDTVRAKEFKAAKRHSEGKNSDSKKAKKDVAPEEAPDVDSDGEEIIEENEDSDIESDEYDIPYDGEDDIEDDDDENDDGSGSDDQA